MKTTTELLIDFVNQNPGLNANDFPDAKGYNQASKEITRQRADFFELLVLALLEVYDFERKLKFNLSNRVNSITLGKDGIGFAYCYTKPNGYRTAACNEVAQLIMNSYRDEYPDSGPDELREMITSRLSNRVSKLYFS